MSTTGERLRAVLELNATHRAKRFILTSTVGAAASVINDAPGGEPAQIVDELLRLAILGARAEDLAERDDRITLTQAVRVLTR